MLLTPPLIHDRGFKKVGPVQHVDDIDYTQRVEGR
jgi:hypothetical protein